MSDKAKSAQSVVDRDDNDVAVPRKLRAIERRDSVLAPTCRTHRIVTAMEEHDDGKSLRTLRPENVEVEAIFLSKIHLRARVGKVRAI